MTIAIDGTRYELPTVTVARGTTVTWENRDPFPHTVTDAGKFDSGSIAPGSRWRYVANKPGTYEYICTFHPNMHGVLVVE